MIAEVFRDNTIQKLTFFVSKQIEIPLEVFDALLRAFEKNVGRTFIDYDSPEYGNSSLL